MQSDVLTANVTKDIVSSECLEKNEMELNVLGTRDAAALSHADHYHRSGRPFCVRTEGFDTLFSRISCATDDVFFVRV